MDVSVVWAEPRRASWRSGTSAISVLLATALSFGLSLASTHAWWTTPGETGVNVSPGLVHTACLVLLCGFCPLQLLSSLRATSSGLKAHRAMADAAIFAAIIGTGLTLLAFLQGLWSGSSCTDPAIDSAQAAAVGSKMLGVTGWGSAARACAAALGTQSSWISMLPFVAGHAVAYSALGSAEQLSACAVCAAHCALWGGCAYLGIATNRAISTTKAYSIQAHIQRAHWAAACAVLLSAVHAATAAAVN